MRTKGPILIQVDITNFLNNNGFDQDSIAIRILSSSTKDGIKEERIDNKAIKYRIVKMKNEFDLNSFRKK